MHSPSLGDSHVSARRFPVAGAASDGFSTEREASATCYCGAVQLRFPIIPPGLIDTFTCHCSDCRKLTASTHSTNLIVLTSSLSPVRGLQHLTTHVQSHPIIHRKGHSMTSSFCALCGTLMMRRGSAFPGSTVLRLGTVDDFALHEGALKPRVEQFVEGRVGWVKEVEGAVQCKGSFFGKKAAL